MLRFYEDMLYFFYYFNDAVLFIHKNIKSKKLFLTLKLTLAGSILVVVI